MKLAALCTAGRDLAFLSALNDEAPQFPHSVYVEHTPQEVQTRCKEFPTNEDHSDFFSR